MRKFITTGILAVCLLLISASNSTAQTYTWGITITLPYTSCNTQTISGMPSTSYGSGSWQSTITLQRQVGASWTNVQTIVTTNGAFANFPNTVTGYYRVASGNKILVGATWVPNGSTVYSSGGTFIGPYTVDKSLVLSSINLNGTAVSPTVAINVYACSAVIQNNIFTGDNDAAHGSQYQLVVRSSNSSALTTGTIRYTSGWVAAGIVPTSFDLVALTSSYITANPGYYLTTLEIKNTCNAGVASTKSGLFQMIAAPTAAAADFRWVEGVNLWAPSHTLPGVLVGGLSLSLNGSYSSGYIEWFQLTLQEVNATTGANIGSPIPNNWSTPQSAAGISYSLATIVSQNVNSLSSAYFYLNFNVAKRYKLTLTVGNTCGQSSEWSYFWCNSQTGRMANPNLITGDDSGISLFPSPANEQLQIQYNAALESNVTVSLVDASGRNVLSTNQGAPA
ncbi:MAG: hypothetical protein M3R17_11425, partial [Bacteroidota bacterium]|nr:hypothetical protein [Bacteroidota bacterium]